MFPRLPAIAFALLGLIFGGVFAQAQTGFEVWHPPGEEVTDGVAVRYKCRVVQNTSPLIMILFGANRFYGPSDETYLIEHNLYSDDLLFTNGICTTWPQIGTDVQGSGSLRSAVPDYNEHGWIGAQPTSPLNFPRQIYWIDGIRDLVKMDMITQTNLNGVECDVELTRCGLVTNLSGWNCAGQLDTNVTFREWDATITFAGSSYTNRFALPDTNARYITSYETLDFYSEFFWRTTGQFQVYLWNLELQREGQSWWRRVNEFNVYRQDNYPTNYGVRIVSDNGTNVIEISNAGGSPPYLPINTVFDLGVSLTGTAPDLVPSAISVPASVVPGGTVPVVVTASNASAVAVGSFATGCFLSTDPQIGLNDQLVGAVTNQAGLPGFGTVTFTNLVTIPADAGPGLHYLGAILDYPGVVVETIKTNNTINSPVMVLGCLPSVGDALTNAWQIPAGFDLTGWLFEDFPDTRPGGSAGGGTNSLSEMTFAGDLELMNGTITNAGPAYTAPDFYPYVLRTPTTIGW